ncbi:endo alpha-1,4 polygalactosaminidase [Actinacidiphila yeochonensis]|uniref:endo alpha-1,4 polygalactosaminidase n=1 Tax=Actinacidiphila yeochonensis TaxID=89050 RepID=UPI0018E396D3|nr:endo alpha-1,4 polygalactosaminidase [Actinacidiphila yeochonensis]
MTGGVDYQLGGAYTPPSGVTVVVRDASAEPAAGVYSICYINGFQTQADQASEWTGQHAGLLLHDSKGKVVSDPNWPGEYVLDPSTAANRAGILAIMQPLITGCANDGYKAVEFDNLDTFTRFSSIPESGTAALAQAYTAAAHKAGLAAAQKNAAEYSRTAHDDWGFDFAIAEECHVYDECGQYTSVYGQRVVEVEYPDDLKVSFDSLCSASDRVPLLVERDRDLVTPSDRGYLRRAC